MSNQTGLELFAFFGGGFFIFVGLLNIARRRRLLKVGITTEATVVSIRKDIYYNNRSETAFYPTIEYTAETNEIINREYSIGTNPSKYKEGDKLIIIYDPENIKSFIINDTPTKIIWPIFLLGGIALMILGIFLIVKDRF